MRLTDATVVLRPRNAWEALDLGVSLARRHAGLLAASWALLTLPVFALLSLTLWSHPALAIFLFWLLKPAYERLPLFILSRALFDDPPGLREAFRALPGLLRPQLLASLTWRRLDPRRSFALPVLQLEGLSGTQRARRLAVLGRQDARAASWLTLVGAHVEAVLCFGAIGLVYLMVPEQLTEGWGWRWLLGTANGHWLWLDHLSNLLYALVLIVWEPVYVACGFTLYLNRRTVLDAWDIELAFRRLRQRLTGTAALLLAATLLLPLAPSPARADSASCPIPLQDPLGPESPRLSRQGLTSQAAREAIQAELARPPFSNKASETRWRFGDAKDEPFHEAAPSWLARYLRALAAGAQLGWLPTLLEALLWAVLIGLIVLLAWRYRDWLRVFAGRLPQARRAPAERPAQLFGLDLAPESLPEDVPGRAEALWAEQPREALGLLYRALLSRLLHDYGLPIRPAHTETEVLRLAERLQRDELVAYASRLTAHWQQLAYGHRPPPSESRQPLCDGWRALFGATP